MAAGFCVMSPALFVWLFCLARSLVLWVLAGRYRSGRDSVAHRPEGWFPRRLVSRMRVGHVPARLPERSAGGLGSDPVEGPTQYPKHASPGPSRPAAQTIPHEAPTGPTVTVRPVGV
jgi:hypothetical protein